MINATINKFAYFLLIAVLAAGVFIAVISYTADKDLPYISPFPDGKNFAFTITDDAHGQTVSKIRPVYEYLYELGLRTTIAVYVRKPERTNGLPDMSLSDMSDDKRNKYVNGDISVSGDTLQQKEYREYIKELGRRGFEIAMHTATSCNDDRETMLEGYEKYREIFGEYPKMNIMHSKNLENVYWGSKVFDSSLTRWFFENIAGLLYKKAKYPFKGDDPQSRYFWGDILKEKTKYVRLWGTHDIDTLKFNPSMPYHNPAKPYVNYWYSFSEAHTRKVFNRLLSDENIERLSVERGASIVYTHFASNFVSQSSEGDFVLNGLTKKRLEKISRQKDGWFVTASELLDRLLLIKKVVLIETDESLIINNQNDTTVSGVTLLGNPGQPFYETAGEQIVSNNEGEIIIGELGAFSSKVLHKKKPGVLSENNVSWREKSNLVFRRILVLITTLLDI